MKAELLWTEHISPTSIRMRWRASVDALEFEPGQFYRFTFNDSDGAFERSYTFAQYENDCPAGDFDLLISETKGGRATQLLFDAAPGLSATLSGPYGRLVLPGEGRRLFLVATSAGLAPYLPMLHSLEQSTSVPFESVHLLFGVRSPVECLCRPWLDDLALSHAWFDWEVFYSQSLPSKPAMNEHEGYVTSGLQDPARFDPAQDWVLLCGNPMMVDEGFALMKERGFKSKRVIREKYLFARQERKASDLKMSDADRALLQAKMARYQATPDSK